jgi:hypothetical protein
MSAGLIVAIVVVALIVLAVVLLLGGRAARGGSMRGEIKRAGSAPRRRCRVSRPSARGRRLRNVGGRRGSRVWRLSARGRRPRNALPRRAARRPRRSNRSPRRKPGGGTPADATSRPPAWTLTRTRTRSPSALTASAAPTALRGTGDAKEAEDRSVAATRRRPSRRRSGRPGLPRPHPRPAAQRQPRRA